VESDLIVPQLRIQRILEPTPSWLWSRVIAFGKVLTRVEVFSMRLAIPDCLGGRFIPRGSNFSVEKSQFPCLHATKCYEEGNICQDTRVCWIGLVQMIRTQVLMTVVTLVTAGTTARQQKQAVFAQVAALKGITQRGPAYE
jgi:hypothetical protein